MWNINQLSVVQKTHLVMNRMAASHYKQLIQFLYVKAKDFQIRVKTKNLDIISASPILKKNIGKVIPKISTSNSSLNISFLRTIDGIYFSYWLGRLATMFMREGLKKRVMANVYKMMILTKFQVQKSPLLVLYEILETVKPVFLLRKFKRGRRSKLLNLYPYIASNTKRYLKSLQWFHDDLEIRKKKRKTINNLKKKLGDSSLNLRKSGSVDTALHFRLFFKINEVIGLPDRVVHSRRYQRKHLLYKLRDEQNNLSIKNQHNVRFNWRKKQFKKW